MMTKSRYSNLALQAGRRRTITMHGSLRGKVSLVSHASAYLCRFVFGYFPLTHLHVFSDTNYQYVAFLLSAGAHIYEIPGIILIVRTFHCLYTIYDVHIVSFDNNGRLSVFLFRRVHGNNKYCSVRLLLDFLVRYVLSFFVHNLKYELRIVCFRFIIFRFRFIIFRLLIFQQHVFFVFLVFHFAVVSASSFFNTLGTPLSHYNNAYSSL